MVSRKGITISYDIQNDLNYKSACFEKDVYHAVAGLMAVSTSIHNDFTLDFGDSTCDNIVTVKTGDLEFDLELENEQKRKKSQNEPLQRGFFYVQLFQQPAFCIIVIPKNFNFQLGTF
eukprot:TRINITY_DN82094_c0_g1_i1.p1 TRINITY_DN82094_c0_g1~~TRINITY_DN82094_c0_g1_i1.p1  ORF type:complete len:126 (+),score=5.79 TRINITY_DN82094_c0_g1_i1:27-380(+)